MTNRRFRALTLPIFALLCARRTVEAGFLVVKAQWLQFVRSNAQGARIYKTLRGERFLNTSVISRIGKVALLPLPRVELQLSVVENQRILDSAAGR
jgi:hypothetical protein